ncbi:MAG: efflux RND transporter periplasmic adaptor subunit [Burkholderiales bacterium]|nr:efflux RND transporter periplasmic adaptor subunit [Burkholderiales bacterium]
MSSSPAVADSRGHTGPLHRPALLALLPLAAILAAILAACGAKDGAQQGGGAGGPPPATVGVVTMANQTVALQTELPGRVSSVRVAQVRARVNGVVLQRLFREGSEVKAGQLLYQIDPAPYKAALESAQASLARAQANLAQASAQVERYKPLVEANAISKQEFTTLVTAEKQAQADVTTAKAAVQTAQINLNYAAVSAPISGRIGQALVTEGALVSAAEATQLAVIQQTGTMYVNFTQSTTDVLRLRKALATKQVRASGDGSVPVRVVLEDGTELPKPGKLLFSDLTVDATSGQITLRAEVPNPDGLLLPGQYVRVRLSQAELPAGMLLPQQAVTRTNQGDTVMVVGADGKPSQRPIKVGNAQGNQWVILDGLKPGEQVIADGFQKMMVPGAPVKTVPWTPGGAQAPAAPASGASAPASAASAAASK